MLPEGAVRQKMMGDGFAPGDIEAFVSGQVSYLPPPSVSAASSSSTAAAPPRPNLGAMLQQAPTLRSAPPPPARTAGPASLLDQIRQGPNLKAVAKDDARMKNTPGAGPGGGTGGIVGGGGLLGMLAMEMSKRRFNMAAQVDDSDSDSGFSSSGSDSD
jgi:hypothetical protein